MKTALGDNGRATVPFQRFIGYDRGEAGNLIVNHEETKIIEYIYSLFILGFTISEIKEALDINQVKTPEGGEQWHQFVVRSTLANEKYKGDALLQKSFTVDFMTKKKKKNEGELPQYYVENSHEAIIPRKTHDYVQQKLEQQNNKQQLRFGRKVICQMCGNYFGSFRIHPNWHGGKIAWRCRNKYNKINRCPMRHVYDDRIHEAINDATFKLLFKRKDLLEYVSELTGVKVRNIRSMMRKMDSRCVVGMLLAILSWKLLLRRLRFRRTMMQNFGLLMGGRLRGKLVGRGMRK